MCYNVTKRAIICNCMHVVCFLLITVRSKLTIKELQRSKIISAIGPKWYESGIELLDADQLTRLRVINSNFSEVTRHCTEMLLYWLETHPNAIWLDLIEAMKGPGVELHKVAAMIEALFFGMFNNCTVLLSYSY